MLVGKAEPMLAVHVEDAGDGLLLEPLARVARIGPGAIGQLFRRRRTVLVEVAVPAQAVTEVDAGEVERRDG